jgi:glycosyltransferase involved in cell wall biosynthesis
MKKKILMILNYFYPDVASTGQLMTELCTELKEDLDITVIAAFPSYSNNIPEKYKGKFVVKERYKNINILRVKVTDVDKTNKLSRIKNIFVYFISSIVAILMSGKQDLVYTISQPPILGGLLGVIAKRIKGAKLIYNIQDFNPEQIEAVGYSKNKALIEFARTIDKHSCSVSDMVVTVGRDMQSTLENRFCGKNVPNNIVINNWSDTSIHPLDNNHPKVIEFKNKYDLNNKFIFMYSGNLGLYYDLENIIKVLGEYKEYKDIVFCFIGEGAVKQKLLDYCRDNILTNITFIPYQDKEDIIYSLNSADVHIVTNAKGIKGVSVPSKVYGVIAVEKPILGILEMGSEARILIEDGECGICCEPGDYNGIKNSISNIINEVRKGNKFYSGASEEFKKMINKLNSIEKYRELFKNML